jgi:3-dehydroquinate synthase
MGLNATGRVCLNLGHTFGHGLESVTHNQLLHGEAVALGMRLASQLSHQLGLLSAASTHRLSSLLDALGLPKTYPSDCTAEAVLAAMRHDKKNLSSNEITLILPQEPLGSVTVRADIPVKDVQAILLECFNKI